MTGSSHPGCATCVTHNCWPCCHVSPKLISRRASVPKQRSSFCAFNQTLTLVMKSNHLQKGSSPTRPPVTNHPASCNAQFPQLHTALVQLVQEHSPVFWHWLSFLIETSSNSFVAHDLEPPKVPIAPHGLIVVR